MAGFIAALEARVEKRKHLSGKRILKRIKALPESKQEKVDRLASVMFDVDDWSAATERDWAGFFDSVLKFLLALLPLILPLFMGKKAKK